MHKGCEIITLSLLCAPVSHSLVVKKKIHPMGLDLPISSHSSHRSPRKNITPLKMHSSEDRLTLCRQELANNHLNVFIFLDEYRILKQKSSINITNTSANNLVLCPTRKKSIIE